MTIIGVDPGLKGAFAVMVEDKLTQLVSMPVQTFEMSTKTKSGKTKQKSMIDGAAVRKFLKQFPRNHETEIVIELVGVRFGDGGVSMFNFGEGFGLLKGIFIGMGFKFCQVRPAAWTKAMGLNYSETNAYNPADIVAPNMFPDVDFRRTPRCQLRDEGFCDAALIAEFLRRIRVEETERALRSAATGDPK